MEPTAHQAVVDLEQRRVVCLCGWRTSIGDSVSDALDRWDTHWRTSTGETRWREYPHFVAWVVTEVSNILLGLLNLSLFFLLSTRARWINLAAALFIWGVAWWGLQRRMNFMDTMDDLNFRRPPVRWWTPFEYEGGERS